MIKPLSDNMRGAVFMILSMALFTFNDACMKGVGQDLPLFQALFIRGIGTTTMLIAVAIAMKQLRFDFPRKDWGLIALRTVAEAAAAWFFITALFKMPIGNLSAILQSLPLTVTLASAFLGERVGWRRFLAIGIGFVGVMFIVQPGSDGFTHYSVYALLSVACVTVRDLAARRMSRQVPSVLVALVAAAGVCAFAGVGSIFVEWQPITQGTGLRLLGAMTFVIGGYIFSVNAMRTGEIGFVAPFRYTSLIVALILGLIVFGEWPDGWTMFGAAIVVCTGLFTLYRERVTRLAAVRERAKAAAQ